MGVRVRCIGSRQPPRDVTRCMGVRSTSTMLHCMCMLLRREHTPASCSIVELSCACQRMRSAQRLTVRKRQAGRLSVCHVGLVDGTASEQRMCMHVLRLHGWTRSRGAYGTRCLHRIIHAPQCVLWHIGLDPFTPKARIRANGGGKRVVWTQGTFARFSIDRRPCPCV